MWALPGHPEPAVSWHMEWHVRFDERGWETERCRMAQATAPILDSILFAVQASRPSGPRVRYQRSYSPRVVGGKVMTPGGPAAAA
jgi:hypothetical protein